MSETNIYNLTLEKQGFFDLQTADGTHSVRLDLFEEYQFILQANKSPDEPTRWNKIRQRMATKLNCDVNLVSWSCAHQFHEHVVSASVYQMGITKKKCSEMLSSVTCTQQSPDMTGVTGQTG